MQSGWCLDTKMQKANNHRIHMSVLFNWHISVIGHINFATNRKWPCILIGAASFMLVTKSWLIFSCQIRIKQQYLASSIYISEVSGDNDSRRHHPITIHANNASVLAQIFLMQTYYQFLFNLAIYLNNIR